MGLNLAFKGLITGKHNNMKYCNTWLTMKLWNAYLRSYCILCYIVIHALKTVRLGDNENLLEFNVENTKSGMDVPDVKSHEWQNFMQYRLYLWVLSINFVLLFWDL